MIHRLIIEKENFNWAGENNEDYLKSCYFFPGFYFFSPEFQKKRDFSDKCSKKVRLSSKRDHI